jgi:hypothetical protein
MVYHFHDMIDMLINCGYEKGTTLFGYGYDFRQSNRYFPICGSIGMLLCVELVTSNIEWTDYSLPCCRASTRCCNSGFIWQDRQSDGWFESKT